MFNLLGNASYGNKHIRSTDDAGVYRVYRGNILYCMCRMESIYVEVPSTRVVSSAIAAAVALIDVCSHQDDCLCTGCLSVWPGRFSVSNTQLKEELLMRKCITLSHTFFTRQRRMFLEGCEPLCASEQQSFQNAASSSDLREHSPAGGRDTILTITSLTLSLCLSSSSSCRSRRRRLCPTSCNHIESLAISARKTGRRSRSWLAGWLSSCKQAISISSSSVVRSFVHSS